MNEIKATSVFSSSLLIKMVNIARPKGEPFDIPTEISFLLNINAVDVLWTPKFNLPQQSPLSMIQRHHRRQIDAGWPSQPKCLMSYTPNLQMSM